MNLPTIRVAAAIIRNGDTFLLSQRLPGSHGAGYWEFPGGKIEPDESVQAALARELQEELGVSVQVGPLVRRIDHAYPDRHVELEFHEATLVAGEPRPIEVAALGWYAPHQMAALPLLPADLPLIDDLQALIARDGAR